MNGKGGMSAGCVDQGRCARGRGRGAFTLVELMVVVGLVALLVSLFLPVMSKARSAARGTACASNLRNVGFAWAMYVAENRGRLPQYVFYNNFLEADHGWRNYWTGIVEQYFRSAGELMLCPEAREPIDWSTTKGYGTAWRAWSGKYLPNGTGLRFTTARYRVGSYGINRYLFPGEGYARDPDTDRLTALRVPGEVPLVMDCAFSEVKPARAVAAAVLTAPPDLQGSNLSPMTASGPNQYWLVMLARHGRAINVAMADGSVRRVPLEEMYYLRWKYDWQAMALSLPGR